MGLGEKTGLKESFLKHKEGSTIGPHQTVKASQGGRKIIPGQQDSGTARYLLLILKIHACVLEISRNRVSSLFKEEVLRIEDQVISLCAFTLCIR